MQGTSTCPQLVAGHKFTLEEHFDADGEYVLTRVGHSSALTGGYRSDSAFGIAMHQSIRVYSLSVTVSPRAGHRESRR